MPTISCPGCKGLCGGGGGLIGGFVSGGGGGVGVGVGEGGVQVILLGQVNTIARHLDKLTQCGHQAAHPLFL
jgi:hypothetical protein